MNNLPSSIADKPELDTSFTSTGAKLFYHQEAMQALRDGSGRPISSWIAPTDICNHRCAFCSVGERAGDTLRFSQVTGFLDQLIPLGLKSVTFSGGGNPLLYKCKETGKGIEDCIRYAHDHGLEVAMITNGMMMEDYYVTSDDGGVTSKWHKLTDLNVLHKDTYLRKSWKNLSPEALDMLTWCRISMSGLDHNHREQEVYVPDFDPAKTSLGFSWIMSDSYEEPAHKHGWVSTPEDTKGNFEGRAEIHAEDRLPFIEGKIRYYVRKHNPAYVRLLSNCLEPHLINYRHKMLTDMAMRIDPAICFSQNKPPRQPKKCFKVLTRPCLNACGGVFPCDSVVLSKSAGHKFGSAWRICGWDEVGELFANPVKFNMPDGICPGCVFADQVDLINDIVVNKIDTPMPSGTIQHSSFV